MYCCCVTFSVLFVYICVLNYCHWVATQLQLNISYHLHSLWQKGFLSFELDEIQSYNSAD